MSFLKIEMTCRTLSVWGIVLLFVMNLIMSYKVWSDRYMYGEFRLRGYFQLRSMENTTPSAEDLALGNNLIDKATMTTRQSNTLRSIKSAFLTGNKSLEETLKTVPQDTSVKKISPVRRKVVRVVKVVKVRKKKAKTVKEAEDKNISETKVVTNTSLSKPLDSHEEAPPAVSLLAAEEYANHTFPEQPNVEQVSDVETNVTETKNAPPPKKRRVKVVRVVKRVIRKPKGAAQSPNGTKSELDFLSETFSALNSSRLKPGYYNSTEVKIMRKHVLKFFNPDKHLTLTQSNLKVGRRLRYELQPKNYFNVTEDFLTVLPEESSPLKNRHFNTCAVVGNSGIILGSKCGPQIDSMDFVIRCNLPPTKGYEKDVGSKANFTTMNPSVIPRYYRNWEVNKYDRDRFLRRLKQVGDQILYIPALTNTGGRFVNVVAKFIIKYNLQTKTVVPPAGINDVIKSIWKNSQFKLYRPSTGAHMYALAATVCDRIHMYGFYPFSKDPYGRTLTYHYYEKKNLIGMTTHNMPEEFRALQLLHQRGALVLHTEPCQ